MTTIYIGGIGKSDVKRLLEQRGTPHLKIVMSNDFEAGPLLKRNAHAYYIGVCHTGSGGALGAMLAFLGRQKCHTFGRQPRANASELQALLGAGVRVFGLSIDQVNAVVPSLVDAIQAYQRKGGTS